MKVIGKVGDSAYICQISHNEIERFMDLYYGKMDKLSIGEEVDLGKGRDFFKSTMEALKKTEAFITANKDVIEMIVTGISVMTRAGSDHEQ